MNDLVSSDQEPATSPASTTNVARPRGPTSSGYLRSLRRLAFCCTDARTVAIQTGNEGGVHRKLYATKKREAINHNSSRLVSMTEVPKSRSRTNTLVLTRPPASLQMRAAALSTAQPRLRHFGSSSNGALLVRVTEDGALWKCQTVGCRSSVARDLPQ